MESRRQIEKADSNGRAGGGVVEILRHLHRNQNGNKFTSKLTFKLFAERKREEERTARQISFAALFSLVISTTSDRTIRLEPSGYR